MTQTEHEQKLQPDEHKTRRWPFILIALGVLIGLSLLLLTYEDEIEVTRSKPDESLQIVSVAEVERKSETIELTAFAEIKPRWSIELKAAVSGRILNVHQQAMAGEQVNRGEIFIKLEDSNYLAELASAEQGEKEARLALWKAQNATRLARAEYKRAGQNAPNDLALKLPQLEIAESAVKSAENRVKAARQQLEYTIIRAPFDGIVTERFASLGQSINAGDRLLKLVDNSKFEIVVELSRKEWNLLKKPFEGQSAKILDQNGNEIGEAIIRKGGGFLDETTRQFKLFLEVNNKDNSKVLTGDFVSVTLPGVIVPDTLNIPASSLTQEGYVWLVDAENKLLRTEPEVLFRKQDRIVIKAPSATNKVKVAITPLVSFLPGQKIEPRQGEQ